MSNIKGMFSYKIDGKIFFRADSQTTRGMYKSDGPYFMVNGYLDAVNLGKQILKTFEECKTGIPHPEDLTKLSILEKQDPYSTSEEAKLLKKLKKTYKDKRLSITFDEKIFTFRPHKAVNKHYSEGIKGISLTSDGNPENLGKTLLQAFDLCE